MAARSVFKFFTKTCSYTFNSAYSSTVTSASNEKSCKKQHRSYSQPPQKQSRNKRNHSLFQVRKISKSLENLRESRYKDEEEELQYEVEEEARPTRRNNFPAATDLTVRDPAKEFKDKYAAEEKNEEGNPIYELSDGSRNDGNYYDVLEYMKKMEQNKQKHLFVHLQPGNLKPYGSNDNLYCPASFKKAGKIVYPTMTTTAASQMDRKKKKFDDSQYKEYSSYQSEKEYPGYEDTKKVALHEKSSSKSVDVNKMNYSTSCNKTKKASTKAGVEAKGPKLSLSSSFSRRSSTALLKKKKKDKALVESVLEEKNLGGMDQFYQNISESASKRRSSECFLKTESSHDLLGGDRSYNTSTTLQHNNKSSKVICDDYVTVKLGQLQEECRRVKRCKPKKIHFGRLPKLSPPDCPCIEDIPLKEGKPLVRLKKRFEEKEAEKICAQELVCTTPRADANYKIKRKTLPVIQAQECPCEEREMTDFVIRRLPKKKIPEPPKVCIECVGKECCPPRADDNLKVDKKVLPKLEINNCPCVEEEPLRDVPLNRLKPKAVKEPERICKVAAKCDETIRADHGLQVKKKVLPIIKSDCACVEQPPPEDVPPLRRLKKIKYVEKPRPSCETVLCADAVRADKDLKVKQRKLPVFVPQNCPCIEEDIPDVFFQLKRLKPRNVPKEKVKVCVKETCGTRADDGMVVKPKQLPVIEPKECPCIPVELVDVPPLKKLVPKPVVEPPKVCKNLLECIIPRSDENLKVKRKMLPVMPPGSCPCVEPEPPIDTPPLKKLKKKPVTFKRICPVKEKECPPRADENLKVKVKKLPKLEIADCPCIEAEPPEDVKPLRRLKKVHICEPPRICPKLNDCEDIPRADEDDWLYWKRVEVKSAECEPVKTSKRSYSTTSRRHYSTCMSREYDLFKLKYDLATLPTTQLDEKSYNIIIDIKPSAPLILTQKPLEVSKCDSAEVGLKTVKRTKSAPVDCVTFVIYKSNTLGGTKSGMIREGSSDVSLVFNTMNRFISTCSTLYEYSERTKDKLKDHTTPPCECPVNDSHLQPKNPIIPEKEHFITPYPTDDVIDDTAKKSRMYFRTRKDERECTDQQEDVDCKEEEEKGLCEVVDEEVVQPQKKLSLWERIVNYFKARPGCPSPEEFKRMRLKEDAEKAASKAGLCLYDPKEMLRKNEKELPKVITAGSAKDECRK